MTITTAYSKMIFILAWCLLGTLYAEENEKPLFKWSGPWPGHSGAIDSDGDLIRDRDSIFSEFHDFKILYILKNGKYERADTLMRISLFNNKTGRIVYASPWSLLGNGEDKKGYSTSFNLQKNGLLTIKWNDEVIAEFTEKELSERKDIYLGTKEVNPMPETEGKEKGPAPAPQKNDK